jgi:hypothetical protein
VEDCYGKDVQLKIYLFYKKIEIFIYNRSRLIIYIAVERIFKAKSKNGTSGTN